jgi:transcriptional regulator with XRE-family HTH domain
LEKVFAARLRQLREDAGLGVRELARILGMSCAAISYYENLKRIPDIVTAKKIADYFNTTCDYLVGLTDERYKK